MLQRKKKQQPSARYLLIKTVFLLGLCIILIGTWSSVSNNTHKSSAFAIPADNSPIREDHKNTLVKNIQREKIALHLQTKEEKQRQEDERLKKEKEIQKHYAENTEKTVYLTFDDGPSPVTGKLNEILCANDIHATFFMLEPNMKEYRKSLLSLKENGHTLGLHGVTHNKKQFYQTNDSPLSEMKKAQETLHSITGLDTSLVRTPFGSKPYLTENQRGALEDEGFSIWDWCIDSYDWKLRDARYVNEVIHQLEKKNSKHTNLPNIILLHDRPETVNSLQSLINQLREKGYTFGTLDENKMAVYSFR